MLQAIGVDVWQARGEADQLLAALCQTKFVTGVVTEDGDLLALGCPCVLRRVPHAPGLLRAIMYSKMTEADMFAGLGDDQVSLKCVGRALGCVNRVGFHSS